MIISPLGTYLNPSATGLPPFFNIQPVSQSVSPSYATFGVQPQNALVASGYTANFSVISGSPDGGTLSYQWQYAVSPYTVWNNVTDGTGGTTNSYTTPTVNSGYNNRQYRCLVTNTKTGLTVIFNSQATDPESPTGITGYQWYTSAGSSSALPNDKDATISSTSTGMTGTNPATGSFYCRATDTSGLSTNSNTVSATIYTTSSNPSSSAFLLVDPATQLPTTWGLNVPQYGTVVWGLQTATQSKLKPLGDNYNTHTVGTGTISWEDANIPISSALIQFNYAFECVHTQYLSTPPTAQTSSIEISYDDGNSFSPLYDYTNNRPLSQSSANGSVGPYAFSIQTPTISNLSQVALRIGISADYDELQTISRPTTYTSNPATDTARVQYSTLSAAYSGSGSSGFEINAANTNVLASVIYSGFTNLSSEPTSLVLYITGIGGSLMDGSDQPSSFGIEVSTTGLSGTYTSVYLDPNPGVGPAPYDILPLTLPTNLWNQMSNVYVKVSGGAGRIGGTVSYGWGQIYALAVIPNWKASSRAILTNIKALY